MKPAALADGGRFSGDPGRPWAAYSPPSVRRGSVGSAQQPAPTEDPPIMELVRSRLRLGALAAVAALAAACGAGATPTPAPTAAPPTVAPASAAPSPEASASGSPEASASAGAGAYVVTVATDPVAGKYLAGEDGKSLYVFKKDSGSTPSCYGGCASAWPPFTLDAGETVSGGTGVTGTFATTDRTDGTKQVTYNGAPLYYFGGDAKAGDTKGQGLNGVWFLATPSASGAVPAPTSGY